ncbi:hypothetical protein RJ639_033490, partial [Escallonia herrerae]
MALQVQVPPSSIGSLTSVSLRPTKNSTKCIAGDHGFLSLAARVSRSSIGGMAKRTGMCVGVRVRSSLETAGPVVGQVTEVNKDTFWPLVNAAGDKTVVLDMYTQWNSQQFKATNLSSDLNLLDFGLCGPCKVMAPKFQELSEKYLDVVFMKLDCNQDNKSLAKELGIKVVPTFKILKDSKIVKEVTGAKFDDLVIAIDRNKLFIYDIYWVPMRAQASV